MPLFSTKNPLTFIICSILINYFSIPMFLILVVLALIALPSVPFKLALSRHLIFEPITLILTTILIFHDSLALSFAILKLSFINISIGIEKFAISAFLIQFIVTFKFSPICPALFPFSVPLITLPIAFISSST